VRMLVVLMLQDGGSCGRWTQEVENISIECADRSSNQRRRFARGYEWPPSGGCCAIDPTKLKVLSATRYAEKAIRHGHLDHGMQ
jgi:hypothetical protein